MYKDEKDFQNEQDVDLTSMINDYGQDSELRKKIDDLKKQKEAEKNSKLEGLNPLTNKAYESSIFNEDKGTTGIPNIQIDDTIEKTKVDFNDDANKTLVIMNGKKSMSTEAVEDTSYSDYEEVIKDFDDESGKTVITPISNLHDVQSFEEDDEEDIHDEGEKKTNKIVTYILIGIVSLVILVGGFFGVKYAIENFLGSDTPKSEVEKPAENTPEIVKPETPEETPDITDNSAKIASLKKQKETYQAQVQDAKDNITGAKSKKKTAEETLMKLNNNELPAVTAAQKKADEYYVANQVEQKQKAYELAKGSYETTGSTDAALKAAMVAAKSTYDVVYQEYQNLVKTAANLTNNYNDKKSTAENSKSSAASAIEKYMDTQSDLESKIKEIDEQLKELEKSTTSN